MSPWAALAWLWLLSTVINLVSGLVMALVPWGVGARPTEVRFHQGPSLWAFRIQGIRWSFGLMPFGASVSFKSSGSDETEGKENAFTRLSPPRRLIVSAVGCYGMILLALVCLPPSRGVAEIASGFEQIVNVFSARQRVLAFFSLLETEGFWTALGVLSAKLAALNLLPIPPMPGYMLPRELWLSLSRSRTRSAGLPGWSITVVLLLMGAWVVGICSGLLSLNVHGKAAEDGHGRTITRDGER